MSEYYGEAINNDENSILLHMHKQDIKIGMKLYCIKKLRDVTDSELIGAGSVRDLQFVKIHREFSTLVDEGKYKASEFEGFLNDLNRQGH